MMRCHLRVEVPPIVNSSATQNSVGTSTKECDQDIALDVPDDAGLESGAELVASVAESRPKVLRAAYPYFENPVDMLEGVLGARVIEPQPGTEVHEASRIKIRLY